MDVTAGTYRHWKGLQYLVLGLGHDANDPSRTAVIYVPLYPVDGPPFAVRTLADFTAWVDPTDGQSVATQTPGSVPRFERLT